jgi:4-coumarate--CoA ligase
MIDNLLQMDIVEGPAVPQDHKLYSPLPFFHIYGLMASLLYSGWKGNELITTSDRFDLETFCSLVQEHKPERAHLVPPIILGLAKHPVVGNYDLSSIKMIVSAAAPLGVETEEMTKKRLGTNIKQAWGMSELSPLGTMNCDFKMKKGSVGPLMPSTHGKILDVDTGKSLGPYEPGELLLKGPQVMMGYLNDNEKTDECLSDGGWLRTGDLAYYDEDGYFFITDRIKELIKVRGFQVAPAELEELILNNEHVADVAVVQIPDEISGELPRAYVVLKSSAPKEVTEEYLKGWVKERVSPHKRIEGGVVFTDAIPKSASGKILRRLLRDKVKEEFASKLLGGTT